MQTSALKGEFITSSSQEEGARHTTQGRVGKQERLSGGKEQQGFGGKTWAMQGEQAEQAWGWRV